MVKEGEYFEIACDFNGDINDVHYEAQWNKGSWRDIVFNGPSNKYRSYRTTDCPSGVPCCSFTDVLVVSNATTNDTDWYTCLAWAAVSGSPQGITLSVYIGKLTTCFASTSNVHNGYKQSNQSEWVIIFTFSCSSSSKDLASTWWC